MRITSVFEYLNIPIVFEYRKIRQIVPVPDVAGEVKRK